MIKFCEDCKNEFELPDWDTITKKCKSCQIKLNNSIKRAINSIAVGFELRLQNES